MTLTRDYKQTVVERIHQDPEFEAALYQEAVSALLEGEMEVSLSILRDLVRARVTFPQLASWTKLPEKSLHRMLGTKGNPTAQNLALLLGTITRKLGLRTTVSTERIRKPGRRRELARI